MRLGGGGVAEWGKGRGGGRIGQICECDAAKKRWKLQRREQKRPLCLLSEPPFFSLVCGVFSPVLHINVCTCYARYLSSEYSVGVVCWFLVRRQVSKNRTRVSKRE